MATISCHSNQSSYPIGKKNSIIHSPGIQMLYVKFGKNRLLASEEMLFENVDDAQTDVRWMPAYITFISSPIILRLR